MRGRHVLHRLWRRAPTPVSMLEGYAKWAPRYPPFPHNPLMEAEAAVMASLLAMVARGRALDVGTGTGRNLALLEAAGARTAIGIDLSPSMLTYRPDGRPRVRGDAQRLPFASRSFDVVSSSLMVGDVADLGAWIAEAARVLTCSGHLVYSDFHPSWATAGWRRTFTGDDGRQYQLPFHAHAIEQHLDLLRGAGLAVRAVREPKLAGGSTPVVVVLHAEQPRRVRAMSYGTVR